jgi:PAS domain S-box-containing protein
MNVAQSYLDSAIAALHFDGSGRRTVLDALPVPVYLTDPNGLVTYWNRACVEFAGRAPQTGQDRWCVTWQLHTTNDEPLPHGECPMAVAIREKRPIRGEIAIAMRPDGSRRAFLPYPTPLFDDDGELIGAINMLIDISDEQAQALSEQAEHCYRLASSVCDGKTAGILRGMAEGYQRNATALRQSALG